MEFKYAASIVLEAHLHYVKEYARPVRSQGAQDAQGEAPHTESAHSAQDEKLLNPCFFTYEEGEFFEVISETLLPLLEILERLERDHIHYRIALVLSPLLCQMLCDELLQKKYLNYLDNQIEFGKDEIKRTKNNEELNKLALSYHNKITERKTAYTEQYEKNLLKAFDSFKRKGKLEILASCATGAFLPAIENNPESIQAQIEIPVSFYRKKFGFPPQGFWLPHLGWTPEVEPFLRAYNFNYTIIETSGLLFGTPAPAKGVFYPVKTNRGTLILAKDYYSSCDIEKFSSGCVYRNNKLDAGYELPSKSLNGFLTPEGERRKTGFKYASKKQDGVYDPQAASARIKEDAKLFLERTIARLQEASKHMNEVPISLHANNACSFGRFWHEGFQFLEELFRLSSSCQKDLVFFNPGEYIYMQDILSLQVTEPAFSSDSVNGYAEFFINSSCDHLFRHMARAMDRMTEISERFPDDTGIKERALNQAAREILLAQSLDGQTAFSRKQAEDALRNFTTIYEALGSNYISTEWLTRTERMHNLFPNINYRVFRRKIN